MSSSVKNDEDRCLRLPGFRGWHPRGRPPGHRILCCFRMHNTHLCIPSAKARLPGGSGQPGAGWLSATVDSSAFLSRARNQSPGRDWLFAGDGTTATSGSIECHYKALWGQLEPKERNIRREKTPKRPDTCQGKQSF